MSADQLREAYRLIKAGSKQEATQILIPIVRTDKTNADAWWLLANALSDPEKQRKALEEVLKLRPDDERAQRMYARLTFPPTSSGSSVPLSTPVETPVRPAVEPEPANPRDNEPMLILDEHDSSADDDPFVLDDSVDPFDDYDYEAGKGKRVAVRRSSKGTSPLVILLALIGVAAFVSCGACLLVTGGALTIVGSIFPEIARTVAADPQIQALMTSNPEIREDFETLVANPDVQQILGTTTPAADSDVQPFILPTGAAGAGATFDGDVLDKASIRQLDQITYGQTIEGTVDAFVGDAYTFDGDAGDAVTIRVDERDGELDPQVFLYQPDGRLLAMHDDIDFTTGNRNALIEQIPLPDAGTYTIVVRAFSGGGDYTLSLERE